MSENPTRPEEPTSADAPTPAELSGPIEALLLMSEEPVAAVTLAQACGAPVERVTACLAELGRFYDETRRGFELRHVGGGWRLYTRAEHAPLISAWLVEGQSAKLSQAALETLAVVAYFQPISRSRVSAVRGVNVDGVIRTLLARGLIAEAGADEASGAMLFATTELFLEKLGLNSLDELPEIAPHLPEAQALEEELSELAAARETVAEPQAAADQGDAVAAIPDTAADQGDAAEPAPENHDHEGRKFADE